MILEPTFARLSLAVRRQRVRAMIDRMQAAYGLNNNQQLAAIIGCHAGTITNWGTCGWVPLSALFACHQATGQSMDWLLDGRSATEVFLAGQWQAHTAVVAAELKRMKDFGLISDFNQHIVGRLALKLLEQLNDVFNTANPIATPTAQKD
jgi:hypothetical protein